MISIFTRTHITHILNSLYLFFSFFFCVFLFDDGKEKKSLSCRMFCKLMELLWLQLMTSQPINLQTAAFTMKRSPRINAISVMPNRYLYIFRTAVMLPIPVSAVGCSKMRTRETVTSILCTLVNQVCVGFNKYINM